MDIEIHVLELVSDFLVLELISVVMEDLGVHDWHETSDDSKSEGPSLIGNITVDGSLMPNSELCSACNDKLEVRNVKGSDSQVPCPLLFDGLELVFDLIRCLWTEVSCNHESDKE